MGADHYAPVGRRGASVIGSRVIWLQSHDDETAARRGHQYISLFVDVDRARVVFATEGKDAETVAAFADDLRAHGGDPDAVAEVCIDMSPAFIKGTADSSMRPSPSTSSMPSRSSTMPSIRYDEPSGRTTNCWPARATSGGATRTAYPSARRSSLKACPCAISRPRAPTGYGWPSRNYMSSPPPMPAQTSSSEVFLGDPG